MDIILVYPGSMSVSKDYIKSIQNKTVAILGFGNQGEAHALNLRDSGVPVVVGARQGSGFQRAVEYGFRVSTMEDAVKEADILMFLLPDFVIPSVYRKLAPFFSQRFNYIGFAHGLVWTYRLIQPVFRGRHFLVGPKAAGVVLRKNFVHGRGLPAVCAVDSHSDGGILDVVYGYAEAIGCPRNMLIETTFEEETYSDLFGEQVVLCGGLFKLMEAAFQCLVERGISQEVAFFETCYEVQKILELWLEKGPYGIAQSVSSTAFFGGVTRGARIISDLAREEMNKIFSEIKDGTFLKELQAESLAQNSIMESEKKRLLTSMIQKTWERISQKLNQG